jgi:tryptophan synthase alpha chain
MKETIEQRFEKCAGRNEGTLIIYVTAGDPSLEKLPALLELLQEAGADIIEVGIPFSDPLADGPVVQAATYRAIQSGTTLPRVLETISNCRSQINRPLIAFTYYNPVQHYGLERFAQEARAVGFEGCLMTDLPPDEADGWLHYAGEMDLRPIFLLAPTSTEERIRLVSERGRGFVYCVSRTGVTGVRDQVPEEVPALINRIRQHTPLPVAVGFGIATPEHVRQVCSFAEGAVVGSRFVALLHEHRDSPDWAQTAKEYIRALKAATKKSEP